MAFYVTIGYKFALDSSINVDGSVLLCGKMPMHQLERRQPKPPKRQPRKPKPPKPPKYPHMTSLVFDPQLYLAGLDPNQGEKAPALCANLATYPWFGIDALPGFDSGEQKQKEWKEDALNQIRHHWPKKAPTALQAIQKGVEECVDLQLTLACEAITLPSPLTHDQATSYEDELAWIDKGVGYANDNSELPVYATVALSDLCLRFHDPENNSLLELVADSISARGVDGVYLVVEQAAEPQEARQCANARVLASALHLIHLLVHDCKLDVVTNFFGAFGVVTGAAGARCWSSNWYKSLHRLRLPDQGQKGRAYPSYWSTPVGTDIHLDADFDKLVKSGMLPSIADKTAASTGLLNAASQGRPVSSVPAWEHRMGNVVVCTDHYLHAAVALDQWLTGIPHRKRLDEVEKWLTSASTTAQKVASTVGSAGSTRTNHVPAWLDALKRYRRIHNV